MIAHWVGDRPTTREVTHLQSRTPSPRLDRDELCRICKLKLLGRVQPKMTTADVDPSRLWMLDK